MGPGVGHAPEGRSATRAYLGLVGELPRVNSRASLLSLTPPTGMPALPNPPQHTQRQEKCEMALKSGKMKKAKRKNK